MPRQPRAEFEPGIHHVFARGNNKQDIFLDDADRAAYLKLLSHTAWRRGWRVLSYCLMGNHVHLLIETTKPNLGDGMRDVQGQYARGFNRRHGRSGHLFGGRYGSVRVEADAQLWMVVGYIARNPVAGGLSRTPDAWRWSSHAGIAAGRPAPWLGAQRLLDLLGGLRGGDPLDAYLECVEPAPGKDATGIVGA